MTDSILQPELLNIIDEQAGKVYFGGFQEWYENEWHRMAGCGPTCAANLMAYLAWTRPGLKALYGYDTMALPYFKRHMEEIYEYVIPGNMGLNRVEMFTDGIEGYTKSRGVTLIPHVFEVSGNLLKERRPSEELASFVKAGLHADCPLAFLNLTKGRVKNIQGWHWITITKADVEGGKVMACASDEGKEICFDLTLWYLSTRMRGGLVYFTESQKEAGSENTGVTKEDRHD